jgi:hypothetical protein
MRAASTRIVHRREIKFRKEFIYSFSGKNFIIKYNKTNAFRVEFFLLISGFGNWLQKKELVLQVWN